MPLQRLEGLVVVYDLRDPLAWRAARRHRGFWGKTHTRIYYLSDDYVLLVFRPSPDERWRPWEDVRQAWIERELQGGEAA